VPARIYASEALFQQLDQGVFEQITNVACLPGIVGHALCMPDGHWGYGFPIGGVAAFDSRDGVISPGGIGFDINCGMRLLRTALTEAEVRPRLSELVTSSDRAKTFVRDRYFIVVLLEQSWISGETTTRYRVPVRSGTAVVERLRGDFLQSETLVPRKCVATPCLGVLCG